MCTCQDTVITKPLLSKLTLDVNIMLTGPMYTKQTNS